MLYAKGLTQTEIAKQLGVQQSTVSKDLKRIRRRMKKAIRDTVTDDAWEFARYLTGQDAAIKKMWEIADDESVAPRDRIDALSKVMEFYEGRATDGLLGSTYFAIKAKKDKMYER